MLKSQLSNFINHIQLNKSIELYNEAGLQHELGFYLKRHLPDYTIQLERNIEAIIGTKEGFCKNEIDIYLTDGSKKWPLS